VTGFGSVLQGQGSRGATERWRGPVSKEAGSRRVDRGARLRAARSHPTRGLQGPRRRESPLCGWVTRARAVRPGRVREPELWVVVLWRGERPGELRRPAAVNSLVGAERTRRRSKASKSVKLAEQGRFRLSWLRETGTLTRSRVGGKGTHSRPGIQAAALRCGGG